MDRALINFSDPTSRRQFVILIGTLKGEHWVEIKRAQGGPRARQRAYYFGAVVESYRLWMHAQGKTHWDKEMCHKALKRVHLDESFVNPRTGTLMQSTRSIRKLTVSEMAEYIDKCIATLWEECDIVVPPPEMYYAEPSSKGEGAA